MAGGKTGCNGGIECGKIGDARVDGNVTRHSRCAGHSAVGWVAQIGACIGYVQSERGGVNREKHTRETLDEQWKR